MNETDTEAPAATAEFTEITELTVETGQFTVEFIGVAETAPEVESAVVPSTEISPRPDLEVTPQIVPDHTAYVENAPIIVAPTHLELVFPSKNPSVNAAEVAQSNNQKPRRGSLAHLANNLELGRAA